MPDPLMQTRAPAQAGDPTARAQVLVFAPSYVRREPDGEVRRLPLTAAVTTRPVRQGVPPSPDPLAERRLLAEVELARHGTGRDHVVPVDLPLALERALRRGDAADSRRLAALLSATDGPELVYEVLTHCLAQVGAAWSRGDAPVLAERRASRIAEVVCSDLRSAPLPPPTTAGSVVLAVPPGERHVLALEALGHLLAATGRPVEVVGDLPVVELCGLAAGPGVAAVAVSAHVSLTLGAARRLMAQLRAAAPSVLLAAGGPGFPRSAGATAADLITDDVGVLRDAIDEHTSGLTGREREVLRGLADGQSNAQVAASMNIAPSTVKTHLDHIYGKTRTSHRTEAVAHAFRQGWLR